MFDYPRGGGIHVLMMRPDTHGIPASFPLLLFPTLWIRFPLWLVFEWVPLLAPPPLVGRFLFLFLFLFGEGC